MESRTVLHMVEAAFQDQEIPGHDRKRCPDTNLFRHHKQLHDGYNAEENAYREVHLLDVTDCKYLSCSHSPTRHESQTRHLRNNDQIFAKDQSRHEYWK